MRLGSDINCQRRSKKYINRVTQALISAEISIFLKEIKNFCYVISGNEDKNYVLIYDL